MFAVVFQPCELEPTASKHKFMVQSLYVPDGEVNMDALVSSFAFSLSIQLLSQLSISSVPLI